MFAIEIKYFIFKAKNVFIYFKNACSAFIYLLKINKKLKIELFEKTTWKAEKRNE